MRTWLIGIRRARGMSQQAVAEAVGVKQPTYWQYEHGQVSPSVPVAKKIAKLLGFDWTLFFEERS